MPPPNHVVHLMPDGTVAPDVMTPQEVILYMRVEKEPHPMRVLEHLRSSRKLRSVRTCRCNRYRLVDVLECLEKMAKESL